MTRNTLQRALHARVLHGKDFRRIYINPFPENHWYSKLRFTAPKNVYSFIVEGEFIKILPFIGRKNSQFNFTYIYIDDVYVHVLIINKPNFEDHLHSVKHRKKDKLHVLYLQ